MIERTIEQFFADCDKVNNLDKFEQPLVIVERKPSTRYNNKSKAAKYKIDRDKLVERVSCIIVNHALNNWVKNVDIFDRMGKLRKSYGHNLLLIKEAKELLCKKGYRFELRVVDHCLHEWRMKPIERD